MSESPFETLPQDVQRLILQRLSPEDAARLGLTNRAMHQTVSAYFQQVVAYQSGILATLRTQYEAIQAILDRFESQREVPADWEEWADLQEHHKAMQETIDAITSSVAQLDDYIHSLGT